MNLRIALQAPFFLNEEVNCWHSTRPTGIRQLAIFVAVVGLLLRALIPMGYMPGNLLNGEFMVLCPSGNSGQLIQKVIGNHHGHHGEAIDADRACPIGTTMQYAAVPPSLSIELVTTPAVPRSPVILWSTPDSEAPAAFQARAPPRNRS